MPLPLVHISTPLHQIHYTTHTQLTFCEIVNMEMLASSTKKTGSQWSILNPKSGPSANVA